MKERTLIIIKPDAIHRHLLGNIINRFERKGLKLVAAKFIKITEDLTHELYSEHQGKPFYEPIVKYLSSEPMFVMIWEAERAIDVARKLIGATFGYEAQAGTIRGDLCYSSRYNLVHGSDNPESAEREIKLFFKPDEIINYQFPDADWLNIKAN